MLVKEDLRNYPVKLRELVSAGEPLNPEVIRKVEDSWGLIIRDGYGQTETTAVVANTPGEKVKAGSMGRPLPGYRIDVFDIHGQQAREGQLCIDRQNALGLMTGYDGSTHATDASHQATGDVVRIDEDGYVFFIGRVDDIFKSSDYRISPFELESVAIEHPAILEAAVVPSPDSVRHVVPKAFIALAPGYTPNADTAREIFSICATNWPLINVFAGSSSLICQRRPPERFAGLSLGKPSRIGRSKRRGGHWNFSIKISNSELRRKRVLRHQNPAGGRSVPHGSCRCGTDLRSGRSGRPPRCACALRGWRT